MGEERERERERDWLVIVMYKCAFHSLLLSIHPLTQCDHGKLQRSHEKSREFFPCSNVC